MSELLVTRRTGCPYCGETIELLLDLSAGEQRYIEDCPVCCRPIEVSAGPGADGEAALGVARSD